MLPRDKGYLVKVGSFVIPPSLIRRETYKSSPAQRQDNGSYVDANGNVHLNLMPHTRSKIEFNTITMRDYELRAFMDAIVAQYIDGLMKKVHLEYYEEEYGNFVEGDFYISATVEYQMLDLQTYDELRLAFIEL